MRRDPSLWPYLAAFSALGAVLAVWWLSMFVGYANTPTVTSCGAIAASTLVLAVAVTKWVARPPGPDSQPVN